MTTGSPHPDFAALDRNDIRCKSRLITPQDGLTLRQAMLFYADGDKSDDFCRREQAALRRGLVSLSKIEQWVDAYSISSSGFRRLYAGMLDPWSPS